MCCTPNNTVNMCQKLLCELVAAVILHDLYFTGSSWFFLCFVDRAYQCISVIKTILRHYLFSVYFVNQLLHVSGIFVAHHQEVYSIYTTNGTCYAF